MHRAQMRLHIMQASTLFVDDPNLAPPAAGGGAPGTVPSVPSPADLAHLAQVPPVDSDDESVTYTKRHLKLLLSREKDQGRVAAVRALAPAAGIDPDAVTDDQIKTILADAKAARDAAMTEEQRRQADLEAREKALTDREAAAAAKVQAADAKLRESERRAQLVSLGAVGEDLEVALVFLDRSLAAATDTDADADAVKAAAEDLKKRRAELFTAATAAGLPAAPGGAPAGGPPNRQAPTRKPGDAGRARARAMGLAKTS
jgi:hypothetical protein